MEHLSSWTVAYAVLLIPIGTAIGRVMVRSRKKQKVFENVFTVLQAQKQGLTLLELKHEVEGRIGRLPRGMSFEVLIDYMVGNEWVTKGEREGMEKYFFDPKGPVLLQSVRPFSFY